MANGVQFSGSVTMPASNVPTGASAPVYTTPYALITVYVDQALTIPALLFSDRGLSTPIANPAQTDGQGNFGFWVAGGTYYYTVTSHSGVLLGTYAQTIGVNAIPSIVAYASQLGAVAGVDCTALLNAFLSSASASSPVHLIVDIMCSIRGLVISQYGYTTIEGLGLGTGFTMLAGSNAHGITIGAYSLSRPWTTGAPAGNGSNGATPPTRVADSIILRNFSFNGNGGQVGTANYFNPGTAAPANYPVTGAPSNRPLYTIILDSFKSAIIENVVITNPAVFCLTVGNFDEVMIRNCGFYSNQIFTDGVHLNGPYGKARIEYCYGQTGDDFIGNCIAEGWGGDAGSITIVGCTPDNSATLVRHYVSGPGSSPGYGIVAGGLISTYKLRSAIHLGNSGSSFNAPFNIGIEAGNDNSVPNQIESLIIIGNTTRCTHQLYGNAVLDVGGIIKLDTSVGHTMISDSVYPSPVTAIPLIQAIAAQGNITVRNCKIVRDALGSAGAQIYGQAPGVTVQRLEVDGFAILDPAGTSYANAAYAFSPTLITEFVLGSVDMTHITAFANVATNWTGTTTIRGTGCAEAGEAGGWFDDSQMANGVMYVSNSTGHKLSIKHNGTVIALST